MAAEFNTDLFSCDLVLYKNKGTWFMMVGKGPQRLDSIVIKEVPPPGAEDTQASLVLVQVDNKAASSECELSFRVLIELPVYKEITFANV